MIRFFKELGKAFFIGTLIFLVLGLIQYFTGGGYDFTGKVLLRRFLLNQMYSVVLYMANAVVLYSMINRYKNELFKLKNIAKAIFFGVLITLLFIFLLNAFTSIVIFNNSFAVFLKGEEPSYYYLSLIISVVITSIFYAVYYYRQRQENKVKEQKIIARTASAQFDALKNQLDPHFLFNSLNVLTSLIEENPQAATKFTTSLSKVYRYVLEQKNKELVTVEEELKFANLYMSLIKMRFEDSIVFTYPETIENADAKVVPLSLQLLLENAVKHNQVMPSKKLYITIFEDNGNLVITNNIQPKKVVKESSGVGLQNIRNRYQLLTDRAVKITQDAKDFSVSIPLLTKSTMTVSNHETYIHGKRYERAKQQVEKLKGFYIHLTIYLLFVPFFIWLNYKTSSDFPWAIFPIAGWGFGILGHAVETFNWNPFFGKEWEERKMKQFMNEED